MTRKTIQESLALKEKLPSPSPPPSFFVLVLAPFYAGKNAKNPVHSLVFPCFPWKCLLHRLYKYISDSPLNTIYIYYTVQYAHSKHRSCSIGINRFWLDGLVGIFCVLLGKNRFWLVWLLTLFNQPQIGLKWLKKHLLDYVA